MSGRPPEILIVVGTRPEAVKTAPVALLLRRDRRFRVKLLATGQHREILSGALASFGLRADRELRVMRARRTPNDVLAAVVGGVDAELSRRPPDLVLVQGDTTSALAAALAAFHRGVPVAHLEAGLRTDDIANPFPEELNRATIDLLAEILLAPTPRAGRRLLREGADSRKIYVTGNTVVDALQLALKRPIGNGPRVLAGIPEDRPVAVVTLHRRESHGKILRGLAAALARASARRPDVLWIVPAHPHPAAHAPLAALPRERFRMVPPLDYPDFIRLLSRASFAATDSGGLQEEATALGLRYLVLRRTTERPEGLGRWGILVGVEPTAVERALVRAADRRKKPPKGGAFGDGQASRRVAAALAHWAGLGPRPRAFSG